MAPGRLITIPQCEPHVPINSEQMMQLVNEVMRADKELVVSRQYDIYCVARPDKEGDVMHMTQFGLARCGDDGCWTL